MTHISFSSEEIEGLVSVIVPTFRKERYIEATLASLGRQTFSNWEAIVIEDGSATGTQQLVQAFAQQYPSHRIVYSRNDRNYGAAYTRNLAFGMAGGQFVALLDSDDRWFPDHIAVSVAALQSHKSDIVYSTVLLIEDETEHLLGIWGPDACELASFPQSLFYRNFITPSATVMRRSVLERVGAWDNGFHYCEDADFWMRCVAAGIRFDHVGGCHCLYRKNHHGATTQRLCGTLQEFAQISEQYIPIGNVSEKTCRKNTWRAYLHAAERHLETDPDQDPSADPQQAARLLLRAWRLRPKHVECLLKALALKVRHHLRRGHPVAGDQMQSEVRLHKKAA
jgi:hypothetical protein